MVDQPPPPAPPSAQSVRSTPPGWYFDGQSQRWWDGGSWGPAAPPVDRTNDDKTLSILAHGGMLAGGFILPLVLYLISNDRERPETRWHAREALNFQITFILVFMVTYFAGFALLIAGFGVSGFFPTEPGDEISSGAGAGIGLGFFAFFALIFGAMVANVVFSIIGALRANNGVRWKYPIRIPFVKA
jgi:uncharacterized protein